MILVLFQARYDVQQQGKRIALGAAISFAAYKITISELTIPISRY
jgi:hypothetical protein